MFLFLLLLQMTKPKRDERKRPSLKKVSSSLKACSALTKCCHKFRKTNSSSSNKGASHYKLRSKSKSSGAQPAVEGKNRQSKFVTEIKFDT